MPLSWRLPSLALAALLVGPPMLAGAQTAAAPAAQAPARPAPAANPKDVASVDAILAALYDVISGPAGQERNWDRFRSLFIPGARLIPTGRAQNGQVRHRVMDAEGYISTSGPLLMKEGFFEREIARRTEQFGNIAHAFSTYESRRTPGAAPFARGINSIQLLRREGRWWIVTILWDVERPDRPIPAAYVAG